MTLPALRSLLAAAALGAAVVHAQGAAPGAARTPFADGVRMEAADVLVVTRDRELRMPGTSKTRADLPAGTQLTRYGTLRVRAQGKAWDVELWAGNRPADGEGGFGPRVAVLAVYPEGGRVPTDVAEVATDRETYLAQKAVSLGPDDAFEIYNAHLNAGEDFNAVALFHLRDGRLRRIAEAFTYGARSPNCAQSTRQAVAWEAVAGTGAMPDVVADLETVIAPADLAKEDCPQRKVAEKRTHRRTTYRWDARQDRYVPVVAPKAKQP